MPEAASQDLKLVLDLGKAGETIKNMFKTSDALFMGAAFLSLVLSIGLWFGFLGTPDRQAGLYVGIWVPSIIGMGIYFKLKVLGR